MLSILWEWRWAIIGIFAFIAYAILDWKEFKSKLYGTMLIAKSKAKDAILQSGKQQEEWVIKQAWQFMPLKFKLFISEDRLRKIVYWLYHIAKDKLDDGKLNNSI